MRGPVIAPPFEHGELQRLHGRVVILTSSHGAAITNGQLVVVEGVDAERPLAVNLEFTLRGITFILPVSPDRLLRMIADPPGPHFIFELSPGDALFVTPERDAPMSA